MDRYALSSLGIGENVVIFHVVCSLSSVENWLKKSGEDAYGDPRDTVIQRLLLPVT